MTQHKYTTLFFGFLIVAVGMIITQNYMLLNHDVAVHYSFAKQMVHGAKPYTDFVDMNFPMIWYIGSIAVYGAGFLGIGEPIAIYLLFSALIGVLLSLVVKGLSEVNNTEEQTSSASVIFVLTFTVMLCFPFLGNYGQREHLICFLLLPYAINVWRRIENKYPNKISEFASGFCCAIAVALKPHYGVVVLGLEVYRLLTAKKQNRKLITIENATIVFSVIFYITGTFLLYPDFVGIIRLALSNYSRLSFVETALSIKWLWIITPLVLSAIFRVKQQQLVLLEILSVISVLCAAVAIVQRQGYEYHIIPAESFGKISLFIGLYLLGDKWAKTKRHKIVLTTSSFTVLILVVLFYTIVPIRLDAKKQLLSSELIPQTVAIIEKHAKNGKVYNLTTEVPPMYPAVQYTSAEPVGKYACLWFIHRYYHNISTQNKSDSGFPYHSIEQMSESEKEMFYSVVQSLIKEQPEMIIVSKPKNQLYFDENSGFNCIDYYSHDKNFVKFFGGYTVIDSTNTKYFYKKSN